jgi:hypothetical protein
MTPPAGQGPLAVLQRIRRPAPVARAGDRCEMCAEDIPDEHGHVVDIEGRSLLCACRACALLFTNAGAAGGRYRTVPDRYVAVTPFELSPGRWDELAIPVSMAFFLPSSTSGHTACFYPSPAGATESLLPMAAWAEMEAANPALGTVEPDVEAVLVRARGNGFDGYVVPIDACYELVGMLRTHWRGFDGGAEAHAKIEEFFDGVARRAGARRG